MKIMTLKTTMLNVYVLNIDLFLKNGITTCINYSIMFKTDFDCVNWMYLLFDNDYYSPITDIKSFLGARAFCNSCKTSCTHSSSYKKHETTCLVSAPLHHLASHKHDYSHDIISDRIQFLRRRKKEGQELLN